MPTRVGTRLSSILTGTRKLNTGFKYDVDQLNFHDPKSMKLFKDVVHGTGHAVALNRKSLDRITNLDDDNEADNSDVVALYQALKTDPKTGLTYEDIHDHDLLRNRVHQYGKNVIPTTPPKPLYVLIFEAMKDKVLILLSVAAVVSLALGLYETFGQDAEYDAEGKKKPKVEWVEGVAIIVAIVIVVIVGSVNDYQKERQFAKLNAKKEDKMIVVVRDSQEVEISVYDLLVGDILQVQTGDILPGDAVVVKGKLECDESALTGETDTIKKFPIGECYEKYLKLDNPELDIHNSKEVLDPFVISGSRVLKGFANCLVTAVGENSVHGRTMASLKTEPEVTPMQARLDGLADGISKYGIIAAIILFIVLFIRFCALLPSPHRYSVLTGAQKGEKFLNILITAITIVVVAVPEGLPLAVTLALAFATTRMAKDNNLVRVLKSCETMGGATAICSDKTGTLTENRMRVVRGYFGSLEFNDTGVNQSIDGHVADHCTTTAAEAQPQFSTELANSILVNTALNSSAFETVESDEAAPDTVAAPKKHWWQSKGPVTKARAPEPFTGSKTEVALLILCRDLFGMSGDRDLAALRENVGLLDVDKIVQVIPFESYRKWSGVVVRNKTAGYRLYVKGAAEILARKSSAFNSNGGAEVAIDHDQRLKLDAKIEYYANNALRSICLAHRDFSDYKEIDADTYLDSLSGTNGLIIDGIIGIQDPLREGVADAVVDCQNAGVTVRMVTGDNLLTGKSIALGCGIIKPSEVTLENVCMEGPDFRKLSPEAIKKIIPSLRVLARSSPQDKRILVQNLKEMREVVAVTGDGTNDAPALKLADVGFSMGISGTDVAREASDIILLTDNFSAIVQAIKWGRCVSVSIRKFIQFQLTVNITAVLLTFVSAVASSDGKSVLTAVQLLWVNLIMDTLAALALATDKPDHNILKNKPAGRKAPLISVSMWKMILGQSTTQLIVTFVLHFAGAKIFFPHLESIGPHHQAQLDAMTFNTFVWLQIFKMIVTRKLDEGDGITKVKDRITSSNLNFFDDIFRNWYFIGILLIIGGFQILIMFVGGAAFSVSHQTGAMWGTAIICGLISIPVGWLIRIVPDEWALKIFPATAWKWFMYIISCDFLRKSKTRPGASKEEVETYSEDSNTLAETASDKSEKKSSVKGSV